MKVSIQEAIALLEYRDGEGAFYWLPRVATQMDRPELLDAWNRNYAGKRAGTTSCYGYELIRVRSRQFFTHRLVWELHHGPIPKGLQIDHINGNRRDNRIANLRAVTAAENNKNLRLRSCNAVGMHGVSFLHQYTRFQARITVGGSLVHLGYHQTLLDAAAARKSAELRYDFHANHGRR